MPLNSEDAYEESGRNYRYYFDWRAKLLAGYFALIVGMGVAFAWMTERHRAVSFVIPLIAAGLTVVMWLLD